jgi:hypothetical protein
MKEALAKLKTTPFSQLKEWYDGGLTVVAIAVKFGVSASAVKSIFAKHAGLYSHRGRAESARAVGQRRRHQLDAGQLQLIYGSLLGDAGLYQNGRCTNSGYRHYALRFCHGASQKPYLEHKRDVLGGSKIMVTTSFYGGGFLYSFVYQNAALESIANICLSSVTRRKKVTLDWLHKLDWRGIAYWFMDDGSTITFRQSDSFRVVLCTNSFSAEEISIIIGFFKELGFTWICPKCSQVDNRRLIQMSHGAEALAFLRQIQPYVHPCLAYKIRPLFEPKLARLKSREFLAKQLAGELSVPGFTGR